MAANTGTPKQFSAIWLLIPAALVVLVVLIPIMSQSRSTTLVSSSSSAEVIDETVDYQLLENEEILYVESRHSSLGHAIVNSVVAQAIVQETIAIFNNRGTDPNAAARLVCKIVQMMNGKTYYSIWSASIENPLIGNVSVYTSDNVWISAYDGKERRVFEYGTPRGSKSWEIIPCDSFTPPPFALP